MRGFLVLCAFVLQSPLLAQTDAISYKCQAPAQMGDEIRQAGTRGIESLLDKYPADFWVQLAHIDFSAPGAFPQLNVTGIPSGPVDLSIIARYQKYYEDRPEDPQTAFLYAYSLLHRDTPKAIGILTSITEKSPSFPRAWLTLAILYQSPNFMDTKKVKSFFEGYLERCPNSFETRAISMAALLDRSDALVAYTKALRDQIAGKTDLQLITQYRTLWQLEAKISSPAEQGDMRKRLESDLKFLSGLDKKQNPMVIPLLLEGYQRIGDRDGMEKAANEASAQSGSGASLAFSQARMEWSRYNPEPPASAGSEARTAFYKKQLQFLDEWKSRGAQSSEVAAMRFIALASIPDTSMDSLREEGNQSLEISKQGLPSTRILDVLKIMAQRGLFLDRIPAIAQDSGQRLSQAMSFLNTRQQSDINGGPYYRLMEENRNWTTNTGVWGILVTAHINNGQPEKAKSVLAEWEKALTERRKKADEINEKMSTQLRNASGSGSSASAPTIVRSLENTVVSSFPTDEGRYYDACAQLALAEGRALDGLTYYQSSLRLIYGRSAALPNLADLDAGKDAAALWKKLGGSEAGWGAWLDSIRTMPVPKMRTSVRFTGTDRIIPDFSLSDQNSKTWTRASLNGKTTLINVWATWCGPCRQELPHLQKLYEQIKDRSDIQIITLNIDEDMSLVQPFLTSNKFTFPSLYSKAFVDKFAGSIGIPTTWISDTAATIRFESLGFGGDGSNWGVQTLKQIESVSAARK